MSKVLLDKIKEENQDFEWYPTTEEMLDCVIRDIESIWQSKHSWESNYVKELSILDIGAGNGHALKYIKEHTSINLKQFAIEKSSILINELPPEVAVIGTDFHAQTLIDKKVDVIFCNPPYSEFELWMNRIIKEANCKFIYFVVPERWEQKQSLLNVIKQREANYRVLDSFTFENSKHRQARAKVDVVCIGSNKVWFRDGMSDPFNIWFHETFKINISENERKNEKEEEKKQKERFALIKGENLIKNLERLYQEDLEHLYNNYRAIETLDPDILKELSVNLDSLKEGLKLKIAGLKNLYWKKLFDHLSPIIERLTVKSREKMLERLTEHTCVDFTADNAYEVVLWVIKNANFYFDQQMIEVYEWMSSSDNIKNYKSNKHFVKGTWRYLNDGIERYYLDYRLVFPVFVNFSSWSFENINGLHEKTHGYIQDMLCIANNLGFVCKERSTDREWQPGKEQIFCTVDGEELVRVRAYKNGNLHCKFNVDFIRRLNIEVGRLKGWIKSPEHAAEELGITREQALEHFGGSLQISIKDVKLLTA